MGTDQLSEYLPVLMLGVVAVGFAGILFVGYVYALKKGALDWAPRQK